MKKSSLRDMSKEEILEAVENEAKKWLDNFDLSGKYDKDVIYDVLSKRTFEGKPVTAYVTASPKQTEALLRQLASESEENTEVIRYAYQCIWDYYLMAFYESVCSILEDRNFDGSEFIYQSLFPAFKAGLRYLICLGDTIIGVTGPKVMLDQASRLHCENGPAIQYPDEEQYWWHGVEVEKDWIMNKDSIDPKMCLTYDNVEKRRALCEIVGWDKVLKQLKSKVIHEDRFGELLEVDFPDVGKQKFVRVKCPTNRFFCLPTDNNVKTAHEAVALSYGVSAEEYNPEVRT